MRSPAGDNYNCGVLRPDWHANGLTGHVLVLPEVPNRTCIDRLWEGVANAAMLSLTNKGVSNLSSNGNDVRMNRRSLSKRLATQFISVNGPRPVSAPSDPLSYWTKQTLRLEISGPDGQQILELNQPFARIGAHPLSDVYLDQPGIKQKQWYLHISNNEIFGIDFAQCLNDRNRIIWSPVQGETLDCGPIKITPTIGQPSAGQSETAEKDRSSLVEATNRFLISMPGKKPIKYPISRKFTTIGRSSNNKISIADSQVSKFHCIVFDAGDALWVVDLLSLNPTLLDEQIVDCGKVPVGGRLQVGSIELVNRPSRRSGKIPRITNYASVQQSNSQAIENVARIPEGMGGLAVRAALLTDKLEQANEVVAQLATQISESRHDRSQFDDLTVRLTQLVSYQQQVFEAIRQEHQENCRWLELQQSHLNSQHEDLIEQRREQLKILENAAAEVKNQWQQLNSEKRVLADENDKLDESYPQSISDSRKPKLTGENSKRDTAKATEPTTDKSSFRASKQAYQRQNVRILQNIQKLARGKKY